ncbi:phage tail protein I [Vibrio parahaemolyticus]|uniref:Phage tail protein I n=1 Tax=Vibrio owensii TaxID=696485 RepID=A0AAP9GBY7_9VIBR|nr:MULTISPECIES: phage tail protein I [Vibrio harveyi group]MBE3866050.1 phage tail protein I [Vibrio parahaemolyticus]MCR9653440.1 phage tail protein I [Vibrio parahaemolyticus]QGH47249.1 phage tail protein I [Vibrio owensii]TOK09488.1 phage tail protein I [Vibrio parahaemolyticus]
MLPKIFLKDIRLMALSRIAKDELVGLRDAIYQLQLHDIDTVHESFLPFLAWIYRADEWSNEWPIERKRSVVKNALLLFQYKGTIWAVERALELSMFDASVVPWYAMNPVGTRGTFRIDAMPSDSRSLTQSDYATFITLTESNKQGSQHWKGNIKHDPSLGSAYTAPVIRTRKRWVSKSIMPLYVSDISIEPTSASIREHEGTISVSTTVSMSDGTTTHDVRYESSAPSIATVSDDGQVSYVSEGIVTISAISTFDDISRAECEITTIGITFVMTVGASTSGVGFSSSSSFGELEPKDWNEGASTETRRVHVDIDTLQLTRSAASVGTLIYNKDYTVGAAFSTSSTVYWDLKWNEYDAVKFEFVDVGGNEHLSKPIPFSSKGGNYRIDESNYDLDTYNWLYDRRNQDVYIYVKDGSDDV